MSTPLACPRCLRRAWLLVALAPYIERVATGEVGSRSAELLRLGDEELARAVAPGDAGAVLGRVAAISEAQLRRDIGAAGCWAICVHDELFPPALRDPADGPRALICRGDPGRLAELDLDATVTVVGSRRSSSYGRQVAESLAAELASTGIAVVSGLAYGIDAAAHRGALAAGATVAVLGCGADVAYPAAHRALLRRICEQGMVFSELAPGATPWRWTFPARNRIMAALGRMTVVVEAAPRSGSLITAEMAADSGRDVGAVPGPVTSRTSVAANELLARGACVVRDAQDILDALFGPGARPLARPGPPLDPDTAGVLAAMECADARPDPLAAQLGISSAELSAALARLELTGYLACSPLGDYTRTSLRPPEAAP